MRWVVKADVDTDVDLKLLRRCHLIDTLPSFELPAGRSKLYHKSRRGVNLCSFTKMVPSSRSKLNNPTPCIPSSLPKILISHHLYIQANLCSSFLLWLCALAWTPLWVTTL